MHAKWENIIDLGRGAFGLFSRSRSKPPARLIRAKYTTRQCAWHNSACMAGTNNFLRKILSHEILHSKFIYGTIFIKSVI